MRALHLGTGVAVACMLWFGSACDSSSPQAGASPTPPTPSGSPAASPSGCPAGQATMPTGFPSDFPTYPGAQLTAACTAPGNGSTQWTVQWQTTDTLDAVQAFYVSALDKNDWALLAYSGDVGTRFTATFARKSNAKVTGTLNVTYSTGPTKVALVLNTIP